MKNQGYISAEQYEKAVNTPITDGLQSLKSASNYPAYMDNYLKEVINQVEEETGYNLLTTGMDVYTNVDQEAQNICGIFTIQTNTLPIQTMNCKSLLPLLMFLTVKSLPS